MEVILIYLMEVKLNNSKTSHMDYYKLLFFSIKMRVFKILRIEA